MVSAGISVRRATTKKPIHQLQNARLALINVWSVDRSQVTVSLAKKDLILRVPAAFNRAVRGII